MTMYYLGRLDGRVPTLAMEQMLVTQIKRMTSADYVSEQQRCGAALTEKGQQITQIGIALSKSE
jgi:Mn-dependent DtxR family transcriptional regulator